MAKKLTITSTTVPQHSDNKAIKDTFPITPTQRNPTVCIDVYKRQV